MCLRLCVQQFATFGLDCLEMFGQASVYDCLSMFMFVSICLTMFNYVLSAASIYSKPCPSYRFNLFSSQPVTFRVSLSLAAGPEAVREDKAGKDDEKEGKSWQQMLVRFLL